jgi:hypothetical protein
MNAAKRNMFNQNVYTNRLSRKIIEKAIKGK